MKLENMFKKTRISSRTQGHGFGRTIRPEVPEGLLRKCNKCGGAIIAEDVKAGYYICPKCGGYFRVHAYRRIQMLIDEGKITEDEAADRPDRHHITRAVGAEDYLDVELGSCTLQPGETLLLCSDGLYNMVDKGEYPALARRCLEEGSAAPFLERANQLGGADNITVLLLYGG